jgi:hypothetical protein
MWQIGRKGCVRPGQERVSVDEGIGLTTPVLCSVMVCSENYWWGACLGCGRWVEHGVGGWGCKEQVGVEHLPANVSSGYVVLANGLG